jgi:hypothetical protein
MAPRLVPNSAPYAIRVAPPQQDVRCLTTTCCRVEQQAESGVRWGNKYRPTPKWKRLLRSLRESWRGSLGQLLLEEFGSLLRHIRERSRNRKPVFAFGIPPCPPCLRELEGFGWCDCLRACTRNTTRLRKENPWTELRDVHMAVQSWIAGTDCGVRVYSELRCKESPFRSSSPAAGAILCRPRQFSNRPHVIR